MKPIILKTNWVLTIIATLLLGSIVFAGFSSLKRAHELAEIKENLHILSIKLKEYVVDHGSYPTNLEVFTHTMKLDPRLLRPKVGETTEYFYPSTNASETAAVLVVTLRSSKLFVNKNFQMSP